MTYPSSMVDAFKQAAIRRIMGPKDRFERHKRYLLRAVLLLIGTVFAGPAVLMGFLSNVDRAEVRIRDVVVNIVGRASDDTLIFAIAIVTVCVASLLCNLYYGLHVRDTERAVKELAKDLDR